MITRGQFKSLRAHVMTHLSSPTPGLGVLAGIHPTMPYMTTMLRGYTPPRGSNELEDGDEDWFPLKTIEPSGLTNDKRREGPCRINWR